MQRPDKRASRASLQAEIDEAIAETISVAATRLSPSTRMRLLAFFHLLEHPENASAKLELSEAGLMQLTLACPVGETKIN
jgi:hypothetical protein